MEHDEEYRRARHRVKSIRGFYVNCSAYVGVMILLFAINVATGAVWWVQWPFLGWGVGLIIHATMVFNPIGWLGPDWEERKIREIMAKKPRP